METNLPGESSSSQDLEQSAIAKNDAAIEAKSKTVEDLKAFEASKAEASASLRAKLATFQASLSEAERSELGSLLDLSDSSKPGAAVVKNVSGTEVSIFLKPMQRADGGTEVSIFLKPMQREITPDDAVFLKPMQRESIPDDTVFLKPMQV
jgi:hypothetical protein